MITALTNLSDLSNIGVGRGIPSGASLLLNYSLVTALTGTFSRNSSATVEDFDDKIKDTLANEARFTGARRVEQLLRFPEDLTQTEWIKVGSATATKTTATFVSANDTVQQSYVVNADNKLFTGSVELSGTAGQVVTLRIARLVGGSYQGTDQKVTLTATPTRYAVSHMFSPGATTILFAVGKFGADDVTTVTATDFLLENAVPTYGSNINPDPGFDSPGAYTFDRGGSTDWVVSGSQAVVTAAGATDIMRTASLATVANKWYAVRVNVKSISIGSLSFKLVPTTSINISTAGIHEIYIYGSSANAELQITASSTTTATIDDVTVKELTFPAPSEYVSADVGTGDELITNGDFTTSDTSFWTASNVTKAVVSEELELTATAGASVTATHTFTTEVGKTYAFSTTARALSTNTTTNAAGVVMSGAKSFNVAVTAEDVDQTISTVFTATTTSLIVYLRVASAVAWGAIGDKAYFDNITLKEASHGANVDGVKYFDTENGNTVASGVVTELTGSDIPDATLKGFLIEPARTNLFLNSTAPATQSITVVNSSVYTVSVKDTGSIVLSGAGTGTVTEGSNVTFTASSTSVTCTVSGSLELAQVELGTFATSFIKTAGSTVTRLADDFKYELGAGNFPQEFSLILGINPVQGVADHTTGNFRLFGTDDSRAIGSPYQIYTTGTSYTFSPTTGGGATRYLFADFAKETVTKIGMSYKQEGSNVRYVVAKDGVEKADKTPAGTLDHSNLGTLQIGNWNGAWICSHYKSIKLYKGALKSATLITETTLSVIPVMMTMPIIF